MGYVASMDHTTVSAMPAVPDAGWEIVTVVRVAGRTYAQMAALLADCLDVVEADVEAAHVHPTGDDGRQWALILIVVAPAGSASDRDLAAQSVGTAVRQSAGTPCRWVVGPSARRLDLLRDLGVSVEEPGQ